MIYFSFMISQPEKYFMKLQPQMSKMCIGTILSLIVPLLQNPVIINLFILIILEIAILNKNLEIINISKEASKVKTGCFDENNAFIYSTTTHLKYIFLDGKTTGTFKSLDEPVYVSFVSPQL